MSEEKRYSGEDCQRMFLELRGLDPDVDHPCKGCDGAGKKVYGSTATWRGGCGGQMMTTDVCDRCWGSGDANRPWPSWRHGQPEPAKRDLPKTLAETREIISLLLWKIEHGCGEQPIQLWLQPLRAALAELDAAEGKRTAGEHMSELSGEPLPHYLRDARLTANGMRAAAEIARNFRPKSACTCGGYISFHYGIPCHQPGCPVGECLEIADEIDARADEIDAAEGNGEGRG